MSNKVIGTGEIEIIFQYEKNLKSLLNNVKKEWAKVDIDKQLSKIDSAMKKLNDTINKNTTNTNDNNKAKKEEKDLSEKIYNEQLKLDRIYKTSNNTKE